MLAIKLIEPAQTERASLIVFFGEKDGTLQFCVDYRQLCAVTTRALYTLPQMGGCSDSLGGAKIFSQLT